MRRETDREYAEAWDELNARMGAETPGADELGDLPANPEREEAFMRRLERIDPRVREPYYLGFAAAVEKLERGGAS